MGGGCTNCAGKGGCDSRKGAMFHELGQALGRLYPTRRWGERDEAAAFGGGLGATEGHALAAGLARLLSAATLYRPGTPEETCDYIYVLCVGRTPCLVELREAALDPFAVEALCADVADAPLREVYLRVVLSTLAPFAAVQEVAVTAEGDGHPARLLVTETPRTGVFAPNLLRRLQALVGELGRRGLRHLDFGEITEPPPGFDPGDYPAAYGPAPAIANYLFYPQPAAAIWTTTLT